MNIFDKLIKAAKKAYPKNCTLLEIDAPKEFKELLEHLEIPYENCEYNLTFNDRSKYDNSSFYISGLTRNGVDLTLTLVFKKEDVK